MIAAHALRSDQNGPIYDTRYAVSNSRKVALTTEADLTVI
jgi:hypothetical protein